MKGEAVDGLQRIGYNLVLKCILRAAVGIGVGKIRPMIEDQRKQHILIAAIDGHALRNNAEGARRLTSAHGKQCGDKGNN